MGYPMAVIYQKQVMMTVYNRTKSKAEKWVKQYKGKLADTPMSAAKESDYIFTCVGNDNDLREVTMGEGLLKLQKRFNLYRQYYCLCKHSERTLQSGEREGFDFWILNLWRSSWS